MNPFLGSLFSTLVSPLASLMNHITEHATYPFKVGENVRDLESTTRNLEARMKDINDRIDSDERQALTTTHQVKEWLQMVKDIIAETTVIKEKYYNRSCKCAGRCSLNCCSNYSIGKRAARKLLAAQNLHNDGAFEAVAVKLPPPLIQEKPTSNTSRQLHEVSPSLIQEMPTTSNTSRQLLSPLASLMKHIIKHATYPFEVGDNVRDLERTTSNLEARMNDINSRIEIAERQGLTRTQQVESWLQQVEAIIADTHVIKEKYNNRSCKLAAAGGYSLNCCSNYSIGKRAARKLLAAQNLYKDEAFELVAMESSESSQVDSNLQTALHYLDDDAVTMIGIWGMGGVGKTHLLNQIKNSFYLGNSIFDVVTLVTASKECSIAKIQQEIFTNLGLGEYCNDVQKGANTIKNFLTNRSFLLLVDDLWEPLDLEKVGVQIPLTSIGPYKQKVVLTTRSDEVCGEMNVKRQIKVNLLDDDSAWSLFQENVGEETLSSDPSIPALAKGIVKKLAGLPLALITTGRAMHAKKHHRAWEYALNLLKESRLHDVEPRRLYKEEKTTFHILKFSYESLESDTIKQCFLNCSMWPEDYKIPKEDLIQCWIGLGLVKVSKTLRSAYNDGYDLIGKLQAVCLLQDSTSYGYAVESVKMHDVLRDMALWIAGDKCIVKAGIGRVKAYHLSEEILCKAEEISLMENGLERLTFPSSIPSSDKLTTLFLQGNSLGRTALENIQIFYALTYLDLYKNSIIEFPVEICKLVKLQYLNLGCNPFRSLPEELKSLTNLKYLHLRGNPIHTIPEGVFSELNALQMLDLSHNFRAIANLTSLLEELKSLNELSALGITVEGESQFHLLQRFTDLPFQSIGVLALMERTLSLTTNFSFINELEIRNSITKQILIESSGQNANSHLDLEILRFFGMKYLDTIVWNGVSPRLRRLEIQFCGRLKNVSWIVHLPCLRELIIFDCEGMEYLISSTEDNHGENSVAEIQEEGGRELIPAFPCLQIIELAFLTHLHTICDPGVTFPSLRYLRIGRCPKLKKLPFQPHNIPSKLEKIECERSTWEAFEWDDDSLRDSLQKICTLHIVHETLCF